MGALLGPLLRAIRGVNHLRPPKDTQNDLRDVAERPLKEKLIEQDGSA
jgi:hypothetical protein